MSASTELRPPHLLRRLGTARVLMLGVATVALLMVAFPGLFTAYDPAAVDPSAILEPPSWAHPLGTDEAGADIWARLVYATQLEALIAGGSVLIALAIGIPTGLIAGTSRRFVDWALSSTAAATLAFPLILFAILMVASFGSSSWSLTLIIGFLFFPRVFLLLRAQTKALREREFITAARVVGAGGARMLGRHILPNAAGPLATLVPQLMAEAILIEAGLSYLGLGVPLPEATWGTILENSKAYYVTAPYYAIAAGLTITLAAAALMYAGELVAESSNPMRRRRSA
ncbi:ABC transporter permease [Microbacterium sp. LRZ72]|uniref:ABC transporter permease n=1 Tax=Microbacterium sp. LRZ72 TaxID=2942481 RepID=UPI0029B5C82C|nr:ABC transporter permease [Microbacterium sp. LRZ72]MDX2376767.1 ABC transporter permease [Microbacterium sp. LRZ72]